MVVGGGIGGIQASLDLAESGFKVILVENQTGIGGRMAQLDKTYPTNDCATCIFFAENVCRWLSILTSKSSPTAKWPMFKGQPAASKSKSARRAVTSWLTDARDAETVQPSVLFVCPINSIRT